MKGYSSNGKTNYFDKTFSSTFNQNSLENMNFGSSTSLSPEPFDMNDLDDPNKYEKFYDTKKHLTLYKLKTT